MMQNTNLALSDDRRSQLAKLAIDYAQLVEAGSRVTADQVLGELLSIRGVEHEEGRSYSQKFYEEIGKLTREIHDSMNSFMDDSRLHTMTSEEMPDARTRLNHVMELTESAAHTTMESIERSSPLLNVLQSRANELQQQLSAHMQKEQPSDGLGYIYEELNAFLSLVSEDAGKVSSDLNAILMAQSSQDLTGQVIQRVIVMMQEAESKLVTLLRLGIGEHDAKEEDPEEKKAKDTAGHGPVVPGVDDSGVVQSQDEVDDLLSSLGF